MLAPSQGPRAPETYCCLEAWHSLLAMKVQEVSDSPEVHTCP